MMHLLLLALAQEAAADDFRWKVGGVLATDAGFVVSDRGSRDTVEEEGITGEYSLHGSLQIARGFRASLRACFGCHEFTLQEAFGELDLSEFVSVRAGRLPVPFGGLSARVGHAQMEASSKPLPYIMGHMVRGREFNQGILPAPIVDNGFQGTLSAWLGETARATLELAVVRGFIGNNPDLDFALSRDFEDNNGEPGGAARLSVGGGPWTLGASALFGRWDVDHERDYVVGGVHGSLQLGPVGIRAEALVRETEYLDLAADEEEQRRSGWVLEADVEFDPRWRVFGRVDGLRVEDVFLGASGPQINPAGATDDSNRIARGTAGAVYALRPGFLLKGSAEYWDLSDFDDTWVFHLAAVIVCLCWG